jgi:hypothetical protein
MKIVNLETFLKLPAGTLFMKYRPCIFGDLLIKGESCKSFFEGHKDFLYQQLNELESNGSDHDTELLTKAEKEGISIDFDLNCEGRDGMFEENQLFAIYEEKDFINLIQRLIKTLTIYK